MQQKNVSVALLCHEPQVQLPGLERQLLQAISIKTFKNYKVMPRQFLGFHNNAVMSP
jgi:hypothetical protein